MERRQDDVLCIVGPETAVVLLPPIRPALWIDSWLRRRGREKAAEDEQQLNINIRSQPRSTQQISGTIQLS